MAKENTVILYGIATTDVLLDEKNEEKRAMIQIRVLDRYSEEVATEENHYATVLVYSRNKKVIETMEDIRKNDVVEIFGTLTTTKEMGKIRTCPNCGQKMVVYGHASYVTPLNCTVLYRPKTEEESEQYIGLHHEISNRIIGMGTVCGNIKYNDDEYPIIKFRIALERTIRVDDQTAENDTDFPLVIATGEQAREYSQTLHPGSKIWIKGHLRTKRLEKEIQCDTCGTVFIVEDLPSVRISPHFIEYLHNCNFPEGEE